MKEIGGCKELRAFGLVIMALAALLGMINSTVAMFDSSGNAIYCFGLVILAFAALLGASIYLSAKEFK